jgi:hypothetical protein
MAKRIDISDIPAEVIDEIYKELELRVKVYRYIGYHCPIFCLNKKRFDMAFESIYKKFKEEDNR